MALSLTNATKNSFKTRFHMYHTHATAYQDIFSIYNFLIAFSMRYQNGLDIVGGVTISAKTTKANHVIYTVSYTDPDTRPPLTYTNVVTTPAMGPFSLASGG